MTGAPRVDLRSDTVTVPTDAMREAMAGAEVGDDVLDGDPTVARLEGRGAELLGKEAALFFPSGTQANQAALLLHCRPTTEVVCEEEAHVLHYEYAGAAALSGAQLRPVPSDRGRVTAERYAAAVRDGDRYHPETSLLWLENTHNLHGGTVLPLEGMRDVRRLGRERGLPVHLDGARLWNASAAADVPLREYGGCADTVMVSLSKGLGCPVGSLLAGDEAAMDEAWVVRKRLGGGMRQAGILAAAGLHALEHHLDFPAEDHRRARDLARGCDGIPGLEAREPETNIVLLRVAREDAAAADLASAAEERGVLILATGADRLRAVTHRDLDDRDVERAVEALAEAAAAL